MEHRKTATRTRPAQPEEIITTHIREYTCDRCGALMPEYNAGGYLPDIEGTVARNNITVLLNRQHFSGQEDGYQRLDRDYCDNCLPDIWKEITRILSYQ